MSNARTFHSVSPKLFVTLPAPGGTDAEQRLHDRDIDQAEQKEAEHKYVKRPGGFLFFVFPGQRDGRDEQHGDQAGHHGQFENRRVRRIKPVEQDREQGAHERETQGGPHEILEEHREAGESCHHHK